MCGTALGSPGALIARLYSLSAPTARPADGAALVELLAAGGGDVRAQITRGRQTTVV
ncbi:hypothetical protein OG897_22825 [Streptomyces sp. NBC_00237]|uniref:hypothetical protein n=1 Tax=Streptomyces sp. NBC_00237 TaxID=2975687 RepID=UPI002255E8BF|nr:hypothetical protein [Streptomyces sp. NBC_00237]MCX5204273.1 hypothetical protein [Streptomyces sp. NBC_00237]